MWKYVDTYKCNEYLLSLHLFKCNDEKKYIKTLYSIANNKENNYKVYKIKKKNGKFRTLYEPNKLLKEIQRNILNNVLNERKISKYAKAYVKGVSLKDNAIVHENKKIVLKLDIEGFFDNISFMDVYNSCFNGDLYPKSIGMLFTYLCTYNDYLPQGAVTSPFISNIVMRNFDTEIGMYCFKNNIDYTRYSDDMTFSGDFDYKSIIKLVRKKLYSLGLKLNDKKIHVIYNSQRQIITGLVVNKKVNINKNYKKRIRQEMYYIKKYGINDHLLRIKEKEKDKYIDSLLGKIMFVLQINKDDEEFLRYKDIVRKIKLDN